MFWGWRGVKGFVMVLVLECFFRKKKGDRRLVSLTTKFQDKDKFNALNFPSGLLFGDIKVCLREKVGVIEWVLRTRKEVGWNWN